MTMEDKFAMCEEKREDFAGFVNMLKKQTEFGKRLKSAEDVRIALGNDPSDVLPNGVQYGNAVGDE